MTASYQPGSFNPVESGDVTSSLQQSFQQQNIGWQRIGQAMRENQRVNEINAGAMWKQLEKFSPTVNKWISARNEKRQKRELAEGAEWYYQNGYPQEQADTFDADEQSEYESAEEANKLAADYKADGGDIWTSERFRKLSSAQQLGAITAFAQQKASEYNPDFAEGALHATDPATRNGAVTAYRMNFFEQFGDINPAILNKYVYPTIRAQEAASYKQWYANREAEILAIRTEEIMQTFDSHMQGPHANEMFWKLVNSEKDHFGGVRQSRIQFLDRYKQLVESGVINSDDEIDKFLRHQFKATGQEKPTDINSLYPVAAREIWEARFNFENQTSKEAKLEKQQAKKKWKDDFLKQIKNMPADQQTKEFFTVNARAYFNRFGEKAEFITTASEFNSVTARTIEQEQAWVTKRANTNTLHVEDLMTLHPTVRANNMEEAKFQDKHRTTMKRYTKLSEELAKEGKSVFVAGDTSVTDMSERLASRVQTLARELAISDKEITGDENYYEEAWNEVRTWFKQNRNSLVDAEGYNLQKLDTLKIAPSDPDFQNEIKKIKAKMGSLSPTQALTLPIQTEDGSKATAFFTEAQIETMTLGYGELGWEAHPKLKFIADTYNIHVSDALSMQREAVGLTPLGQTRDQIKMNRMNNRDKNALNRNRDENYSSEVGRTWGTQSVEQEDGSFKDYIVPLNKGEEVQSAVEATGLSGAHISAAMDLQLNIEEYGVFGDYADLIGTFNPVNSKYFESVIKYSNDPIEKQEALNNIVRPNIVLPGVPAELPGNPAELSGT